VAAHEAGPDEGKVSVDGEPGRAKPGTERPEGPTRQVQSVSRRSGAAQYYRRVSLGTVLPGAGLLRTSWRWAGWLLLAAFVLALGYVGYRVVAGGGLVAAGLDLAVRPETLQVVAAVVMVGAVLWVGSIVLTAEQYWPRHDRRARFLRVTFAVLACAVVAAPSALAVRYLDVQAELVSEVFVAAPTPTVTTSVAPTPTPTPEDPWEGTPRANIVLLGSDAGPDRTGVRTDSMMVVSVDTATGDTLLVGIPRNLENVPFPESNPLHQLYPKGFNCGDECLMNAVWTLGDSRPDLFPGNPRPGRTSTVDVLGEITGLDLSHSVVIDLKGFQQLVDAMGGVEINATQRVCMRCHLDANGNFAWTSDKHEWIEPGLQHMDGEHALWYARSRAGSDDFSRMRRQRCVAGALLEQADPVSMFARYPQIAKAVKDNVSVDIPPDQLPAWVDLVQRIQAGKSIRSLPLTSNVVRPANPDFGKIRSLVKKALTPPEPTPSPTATSSPSGSSSASATPSAPTTLPDFPTSDPTDGQPLAATC
jgi:LCP family protein required for cell wall assembly